MTTYNHSPFDLVVREIRCVFVVPNELSISATLVQPALWLLWTINTALGPLVSAPPISLETLVAGPVLTLQKIRFVPPIAIEIIAGPALDRVVRVVGKPIGSAPRRITQTASITKNISRKSTTLTTGTTTILGRESRRKPCPFSTRRSLPRFLKRRRCLSPSQWLKHYLLPV